MNFNIVSFTRSWLLLILLMLAACGGGGGAGSTFPVSSKLPAISATANTTAQNLISGTAMANFTPLTASGGTPPYTYSYTGTLPAGLSYNTSTGVVTGTPTATYAAANIVFSVKDANGNVAGTTSTVSFSVFGATATTTAQNLTFGTPMASFTPLTASGGAAPYTYSVAGNLPAGVTLNASTGAVTGTPTAAYAATNLVFSVKDANGNVAGTTSTVSFSVVLPAGYVSQGGLTWMPVNQQMYYSPAYGYCPATTISGLTGWREPNGSELVNLFNSGAMKGKGWNLGPTWSNATNPNNGQGLEVDLSNGTQATYPYGTYMWVSCVHP